MVGWGRVQPEDSSVALSIWQHYRAETQHPSNPPMPHWYAANAPSRTQPASRQKHPPTAKLHTTASSPIWAMSPDPKGIWSSLRYYYSPSQIICLLSLTSLWYPWSPWEGSIMLRGIRCPLLSLRYERSCVRDPISRIWRMPQGFICGFSAVYRLVSVILCKGLSRLPSNRFSYTNCWSSQIQCPTIYSKSP